MSETKWTPGPWRGGHRCDGHIRTTVDGERVSIAEAYSVADAHLIAAAPDLYEALYRLTKDCEIAGLDRQAGWDCFIGMANAALSRARGEQKDGGR